MGNAYDFSAPCKGLCGYGIEKGKVGCSSGDGSCLSVRFARADPSDAKDYAADFHPAALAEATERIVEILRGIPEDPDGRQLSLLHTPEGLLLAWVIPDFSFTEAVTSLSTDQAIGIALRLQPGTSKTAI